MDADEEALFHEEGFEGYDEEEDQIELPPDDGDTADTGKDLLGGRSESDSDSESDDENSSDDDESRIGLGGMSPSVTNHPHGTRSRSKKKRGNGGGTDSMIEVTPGTSKKRRSKGTARFSDLDEGVTPGTNGKSSASSAGLPASSVRTPRSGGGVTPQVATSPTLNRRLNYSTSGIRTRIGALGAVVFDNESTRATLEWQSDVQGDGGEIKSFRSQMLAQMDLTCWAYMRDASPYIQFMHSAFPFHRLGAAPEVKGRDVAFIGDRTDKADPLPVLLKPDQPWQWPSVKVSLDALDFQSHYEAASKDEKLQSWKPSDPAQAKGVKLPRLLLLPLQVVDWIIQKPRTPYELYRHIIDSTQKTGAVLTAANWKLVTDWCIAASQHKADGNSVFALVPESPATACPIFAEWCGWRIDGTLGVAAPPPQAPQQGQQQQQQGQQSSVDNMLKMQMSAIKTVALELGKSVATTMAAANKKAVSASSAKDKLGHRYTKFEIANLKGFAGVKKCKHLPKIWAMFQTTKSTKIHRQYIMQAMREWSKMTNLEIDTAVYFTDQTVDDIVTLNMVPGDCVAAFETADRGISVLACRPRSAAAVERIKQREKAMRESGATRTFEDSLKLMKSDPMSPPANFDELRKCTNTYAAMLFGLFGEQNDHYDKIYEIAETLKSEALAKRADNFDRLLCSQVAWAYIEDQRDGFSDPLQPSDFKKKKKVRFPKSSLDFIAKNIRFQEHFYRGDFPWQWRQWATGSAALQEGRGLPPSPEPPVPDGGPSPFGPSNRPVAKPSPTKVPYGTNPDIHPRIKQMTETMLYKFKKIMLKKIMEAAGKQWSDLPTIPNLIEDDTNNLCYSWVMGCCSNKSCKKIAKGGHPRSRDVPDDFADALCNMVGQGVAFVALHTEPPRGSGGRNG